MFHALLTVTTAVSLKAVLPLLTGLIVPTKEAVKWWVQLTKPLIKGSFTKATADAQNSAVEVYALVMGAITLPCAAVAFSSVFGIVFPVQGAPVAAAALLGAGAGAWAVGDYNVWKALTGFLGQMGPAPPTAPPTA